MKDKLLKMLQAKEAQKTKLQERSKTSEDIAELRSINTELEQLNADIDELRGMIASIDEVPAASLATDSVIDQRTAAVNGEGADQRSAVIGNEFNPIQSAATSSKKEENRSNEEIPEEIMEKRGKDLKEQRSITVASSSILLPKHQATNINGTFNEVSSLIDAVTHKPLAGGESYSQPYVKGYGEAGYTAEGGDPTTTDVVFGYAEIKKTKITAYSEDTEEVEKLPAAAYATEVQNGVRIAMRKKVSRQILTGNGESNNITGIFNSDTIDASTDLSLSGIDNTTLDDIIFSYGGDEDVEDAATLILNKADLKAFSQLRTDDGKKYHTIVARGNTGTIDGIPYIINSACAALSATKDATTPYCMAYGPLSNYTLAIFSDTEIKQSSDYKFKEGMICHRGNQMIGGNVTSYNGFLRVKRAQA